MSSLPSSFKSAAFRQGTSSADPKRRNTMRTASAMSMPPSPLTSPRMNDSSPASGEEGLPKRKKHGTATQASRLLMTIRIPSDTTPVRREDQALDGAMVVPHEDSRKEEGIGGTAGRAPELLRDAQPSLSGLRGGDGGGESR